MNVLPTFSEFEALSETGNLIPVYAEILADMETPVSAFKKIDDGQLSFLLESIEGGEKWARYSLLGSGSGRVFRTQGNHYEILNNGQIETTGDSDDPIQVLNALLDEYRPVEMKGLPRFCGGAVGYLGYDMVRYVEQLPNANPADIGTYDSCFIITDTILIFDNRQQKIKVVCNVHIKDGADLRIIYDDAVTSIRTLIDKLRQPRPVDQPREHQRHEFSANFTQPQFLAAVERCKEYVRSGDVIQVVLSQRFSAALKADPFDIYRSLRTINPSPYMFFLRLHDTLVVGASP